MTTTRFFALAFALGLLALAWVAASFVGTSGLALAMTALITAVYVAGAYELRQFRASTAGLRNTLETANDTPSSLAQWLEQVPVGLRTVVRLRVEGERVALPGPSLTPYLVGLLVMLGMLGTFLGMVVTFKGAVFALQGSSDLDAIRAALAEPIRGLGLSFGTSVAGVAASAMLGLMSAIARRERIESARLLDNRIAGSLQPFSLAHHRQETLRAMQAQIRTLPEVAQSLQGVMERIERRSEQLDAQLLERHALLQREVTSSYAELARAVGATLRESVAANAQATGETVKSIVEQAMAQVVRESEQVQQRLGDVAQEQAKSLQQVQQRLADVAQDQIGSLQQGVARLLDETRALHVQHAQAREQSEARWLQQHGERMDKLSERDDQALRERTLLLERLGALVGTLEKASGEQRTAIEAMVASATSVLEQSHARFSQALEAQAGQASSVAVQATASAVELAAVADAFGESVRLFQASHEKLTATLQGVEASLQKSTARSDEQLAYYVAQAREVIDLSIASQQGLVDSLRQLQGKGRASPVAESVA